jgi:hypothetical protein
VPVVVRYEDAASTTGIRTTLRMVRELWQIRAAWRGVGPAEAVEPVPFGRDTPVGISRAA